MGRVYLKDNVEQLLRDRQREYQDRMVDPDDLSELVQLIVADADRARALDERVAETVEEAVSGGGGGSTWSEP